MKNEDHPFRQEGEFIPPRKEGFWERFNVNSACFTKWADENVILSILFVVVVIFVVIFGIAGWCMCVEHVMAYAFADVQACETEKLELEMELQEQQDLNESLRILLRD